MILHGKNIKIFAANASIQLAKSIAAQIGTTIGNSSVTRFSDGEINVSIYETVRGCDTFIVQSTSSPVNDNIMELLLMIDAFKRASAGRITAVIPYFGYARQDRKVLPRDPISAKLVADIITKAGADRILTMDLHAPQIQGFFDIPLDHLTGVNILAPYYIERFKNELNDVVVVSPDLGSVARARLFAEKLDVPLAIVDKRRRKANTSEVCNIIGDVDDKICILVDDVIDTAGTICNAAEALINIGGAKETYACATHGVLSGEACNRFRKSIIKDIVFLDTIEIPQDKMLDNFVILPTAGVFAEAIERIFENLPVSTMFEEK